MVSKGIVGHTLEMRLSEIDSEIELARAFSQPSFVLCRDVQILSHLAMEGDTLFAPGYEIEIPNSCSTGLRDMTMLQVEIDIVREICDSREFAERLVSRSEWGSAKDPFWDNITRILAEAVCDISRRIWAVGVVKGEWSLDGLAESQTRIYLEILHDLSSLAMVGKEGMRGYPSWWNIGDPSSLGKVQDFIIKNSPTTAGCIMAIFSSAADILRQSFLNCPGKCSIPILANQTSPVFVYLPSVNHQALSLLLSAIPEAHIFIPEIDSLIPKMPEVESIVQSTDVTWTAFREVFPGADSILFGFSNAPKVARYFEDLVHNKCGIQSVRSLPVERPDLLFESEGILYQDGCFSMSRFNNINTGFLDISLDKTARGSVWTEIVKDVRVILETEFEVDEECSEIDEDMNIPF